MLCLKLLLNLLPLGCPFNISLISCNLNLVVINLIVFFFFLSLYILLQLGDGLVYEVVDGSNSFPHFYGPSRSFSPLLLDAVTKAEKLSLSGGRFSCSLLH